MRWCQFSKKDVYNPKVNAFLKEVLDVCKKHNMEIWDADHHNGLVIEEYSKGYSCLADADIGKSIETEDAE